MKKLNLYYHGGSKNHGCEAIIRSTQKILRQKLTLYSFDKTQDLEYGLDDIVELKTDYVAPINKYSLSKLHIFLSRRILKNDYAYICESHKNFFKNANKDSIFVSVGGDNYCYGGKEILGYYNRRLHEKGAKTVLWGCSVEANGINANVKSDLARYDLIVARESFSYNVLKNINKNTYLFPDPAFQLEKENLPWPDDVRENEFIGINASPLIGNYGNKKLIYDNYKNLVNYLINYTNYNIALIPHVVTVYSDDRVILNNLYNEFKNTNRIVLVNDCNCMQLKGYISRCRMFIGARTHSTIAAYSSCVPTIVTGYSVKAKGIANDLFNTDHNFVLPVQNLSSDDDLINSFIWLSNNEDRIRKHLKDFIPEYKNKILSVKELIESL